MIQRIYSVLLRQYLLIRANPTRFVQYFLWSGLDIILWGFITRYLGNLQPDFNFTATLLGAIVLEGFMVRAMQGLSTPFLEDVWARNFLNIFASPLSLGEYVIGLSATSVVTATAGLLAMVALAYFIFGFAVFSYGIALIPFILVLFLFGIALGIFAVGIVLSFGPSAEWFVWPIPVILAPFVGVFYPLSVLPRWMQVVGTILPPSYVFSGMRSVVLQGTFSFPSLLFAGFLAVVSIALAYGFLHVIYRRAVRTGLIARYSAESVM